MVLKVRDQPCEVFDMDDCWLNSYEKAMEFLDS